MKHSSSTALLLIDIQYDFMPGGNLPVKNGNEILPLVNQLIPHYQLVVATQDWHPSNHQSFASQHQGKQVFDEIELLGLSQTLWPDHCIQNTPGAELHKELNTKPIEAIFRKGTNPKIDSYSGFYDNGHLKSTGLVGYFRDKGIEEIHFCGLALDYCVYFSMVDALKEGFKVGLHVGASKPIDQEESRKKLNKLQQHQSFSIL